MRVDRRPRAPRVPVRGGGTLDPECRERIVLARVPLREDEPLAVEAQHLSRPHADSLRALVAAIHGEADDQRVVVRFERVLDLDLERVELLVLRLEEAREVLRAANAALAQHHFDVRVDVVCRRRHVAPVHGVHDLAHDRQASVPQRGLHGHAPMLFGAV